MRRTFIALVLVVTLTCNGCADGPPAALKAPGPHFSLEFRGSKQGGSIHGKALVIEKDSVEVFRGRIVIPKEAPLTGEGFGLSLPHDGAESTYRFIVGAGDIQKEVRLDPDAGRLIDIIVDLSSKRLTYQQGRGAGRTYE